MRIIERTFANLYGHPCWGVYYDTQLNLSMHFGEPSLRIREPMKSRAKDDWVRRMAEKRMVNVRGEWWLWVFCAYWKYFENTERIATSSSSARQIHLALSLLGGQRLVDVSVHSGTGATTFAFDLDGCLQVRRFDRSSDDELWSLYKPNGYVLSIRGNGTYDHEPGSGTDKRPRILKRELAGS